MNNRELGATHSRYAVRHSHSLFVLARLFAERAMLERDLRQEESKFRVQFKDQYKTKWELDDAMTDDDTIDEMRGRLTIVENQAHIVEGISKGYEGLARAASREISRRIAELTPHD